MEEIFFESQDEVTGRYLIVDEEEGSIWAYLTLPFEESIDKDCFLCSRVPIEIETFDMEELEKRETPPPLTREFSTNKSHFPNLEEAQLTAEWGTHGDVILKISNVPFLLFVKDFDRGFSKSISKNGRYGNAWNEDKYKEQFK